MSTNNDDSVSSQGDPIEFDLSHIHIPHVHPGQEQPEQPEAGTITLYQQEETGENEEAEETQEETPEEENLSVDEIYVKTTLGSKVSENGNIKTRRDLLYAFVLTQKNPQLNLYFHCGLKDDPGLIDLEDRLWKTRVKKYKSSAAWIADGIFDMWMLLKKSDEMKQHDLISPNPSQRRSNRNGGTEEPAPVTRLRQHIEGLLKRKAQDDSKKSNKLVRKVQSQSKAGDFIQDKFAMENPHWQEIIKSTPCPCCDHTSLVSVKDEAILLQETHDLKQSYKNAMLDFARLGATAQKSTKKPKMPTFPNQVMMCMCVINRCVDFSTGRGCVTCQQKAKTTPLYMDPVTGQSQCEMCKCNCVAYFDRMNWSKVKAQTETEKAEKAKQKKEAEMKKAAGE